ncbi:MAG: hypothetical protein HYR56_02990 [Acidobacteria bacterium]|nr:hypothetical protein [Acidobacteriota bacterium]
MDELTGNLGRVLAAMLLLVFAGIGVAHVLNPDRFIARSGVRKGGELLTAWNRLGFRIFGAFFTGGALYMLYHVISDH